MHFCGKRKTSYIGYTILYKTMKIISEKPVPLATVKQIMAKNAKEYADEEKEMLYEQKRAFEHAKVFANLNLKDTEALSKGLSALDIEPRLSGEQIVKICDLMPKGVDDARAIFAKERFKYDEAGIKKIIEVLAKFR